MIDFVNFDATVEAIRNDAELECLMLVYGLEQTTPITITNSDIVTKSFVLDRYCQSSDSLEVGSTCAAELSFSLLNYDGQFDDFKFEGAKIVLRIRVKGARNYVTVGEFVVDEKPKSLKTIRIVALDRMVVMDRVIDWETFAWSSGARTLVNQICDDCDIKLASDALTRLPVINIFNQKPTGETTYRQLLQQVLQICCRNAYINEDGFLDFAWYKNTPSGKIFRLTSADRFSSTIEEKSLKPKAWIFNKVDSEGEEIEDVYYTANEDGDFDFVIENNELVNLNGYNSVVMLNIAQSFNKLTSVRDFTAATLPFFFLQPMDEVIFVTADGEEISTTITHFTFKLNSGAKIECKLPTLCNSGYASLGALTAKEKQLINSIRLKEKKLGTDKDAIEKLTKREEALLSYNKAVNNGVYLNKTEYNGQVYYHNGDTLESSTYIVLHNSEGTFWTDKADWNSSNDPPVTFIYANTADGTNIASNIFANYINADIIQSGVLVSSDGKTYFNLDNGEIVTNDGTYKTEIKNGLVTRTVIGIFEEKFSFDAYLNDKKTVYSAETLIYPLSDSNKITGFRRTSSDENGNLIPIVTEDSYYHKFHSPISTCNSRYDAEGTGDVLGQHFAGFTHYRYVGTKQYNTSLGIGAASDIPSTALELKNPQGQILARVDFYECGEQGAIRMRGTTNDGTKYSYSTPIDLTSDWFNVVDGAYFIKGTKLADATTTNLTIGNSSRNLDLYARNKITCYKKVYMPYGQDIGSASGNTLIEETGEIVIPEDILDYFKNSSITVQPSLRFTTQSSTSYEIDVETGELVEVITPATTTEENADAYFSSMDVVPDILKDEEGNAVNLFTMVHLEWKAIQELNNLLSTASERIQKLENQLTGGQINA